ncbi:MAG: efflux RND transporter periplasmic adaptor subunit [Angelakisella sp.]
MVKKKKTLIYIVVLLVAILCASAILILYPKEQKAEAHLREYKVTLGDITVGVDTDAMAAYKKRDYSFDTEAIIGKINVKVGDMVKKDDVILEISPDSIEEKLKKLNLEYQKAVIAYNNAKDAKRLGELQAEQKREEFFYDTYDENYDVNVDNAKLNVDEAQDNVDNVYRQVKELEEQLQNDPDNASLKNQLNEKKQEYQRANLLLDRAELALRKLKADRNNQLEKKETGGEVARADYETTLNRLENELKLAELTLGQINSEIAKVRALKSNPNIVAENDGVVLAIGSAVGDSTTPYKAVVTIGENETIQVEALVPQTEIGKIKVGQKLEARFEAYPDDALSGEVISISYSPEKGAGSVNYRVCFALEPNDLGILDGMTGEVTFIIKRKENVLRLSNKAIYFRDGKQYVKALGEDGTVIEVQIKTGFSDGKTTEIIEGLTEGQTVVVEG